MTKPATILVGVIGVAALLETPVILVGPVLVIAAVVWLAARGNNRTPNADDTTNVGQPPSLIVPPAGDGPIVDRMVAELDQRLGR
jgi:hypothetical protein